LINEVIGFGDNGHSGSSHAILSCQVLALKGVSQPGVVIAASKTVGRIGAVAADHGAAGNPLLFGIDVEQVLGPDGDVEVFAEVVAKVQIGDPFGAVHPVQI